MITPTISGGDNFITALGKICKKAGTNQLGRRESVAETRVNDQRGSFQSPTKRNFRNMNDHDSDEERTAALPDLRLGCISEYIHDSGNYKITF